MQMECDGEPPGEVGLTHRQIGALLGIGRARVFYHEKEALRKLRRLLEIAGIHQPQDFESVSLATERAKSVVQPQGIPKAEQQRYSPLHGWLRVNRIISINGGSEEVEDVVRAFLFLKERHETLVRPPVIIRNKSESHYVIQATAQEASHLWVRCWPKNGSAPRTVAQLVSKRCSVIVESEFGEDDQGAFDIPVVICIILS